MTFPNFPGAPGAFPGGAPQAPQQSQTGFVLNIPADPTWEPYDTTDTLDKDGYYCCRITREAGRNDPGKSPGVFVTLEIQDEDTRGKIISRFLPDPNHTRGNTWFVWRGYFRSIFGTLDAARAASQYHPGMFVGQFVYVKTGAYLDDGVVRTGVEGWSTKEEWTAAVQGGKHRWPARAPQQQGGGGVGALPGGLPQSFSGPAGLPGAPSALPGATPVPQPGLAPMQQPTMPTIPTAPTMPTAPAASPPSPFAAPAVLPPVNGAPPPPPAPPAGFTFPGLPGSTR